MTAIFLRLSALIHPTHAIVPFAHPLPTPPAEIETPIPDWLNPEVT